MSHSRIPKTGYFLKILTSITTRDLPYLCTPTVASCLSFEHFCSLPACHLERPRRSEDPRRGVPQRGRGARTECATVQETGSCPLDTAEADPMESTGICKNSQNMGEYIRNMCYISRICTIFRKSKKIYRAVI